LINEEVTFANSYTDFSIPNFVGWWIFSGERTRLEFGDRNRKWIYPNLPIELRFLELYPYCLTMIGGVLEWRMVKDGIERDNSGLHWWLGWYSFSFFIDFSINSVELVVKSEIKSFSFNFFIFFLVIITILIILLLFYLSQSTLIISSPSS
jgi:hypothetical protein